MTLDCSCFSLISLSPPPIQLLPSNLFTNILFIIHETCCGCNCPSRLRACRNCETKVPEGPWMADFGAARPGWRSETPNMQPLTPVTSNIRSNLESCLLCSWLHPADLWHINRTVYFTYIVKTPFRILHVTVDCIFSTMLNRSTPQQQQVKWLYNYISVFYFIKIKNTSQAVCLPVRNVPYIPHFFSRFTFICIYKLVVARYLCFFMLLFRTYYIHVNVQVYNRCTECGYIVLKFITLMYWETH